MLFVVSFDRYQHKQDLVGGGGGVKKNGKNPS